LSRIRFLCFLQLEADLAKAVTIKHLIEGTELTFRNANLLFNEARNLTETKAYSRASFLHQISIEECSKVEMLGAAAAELMIGREVDFKALERALRSHEVKNRSNAYYLKGSKAEMAARRSGDIRLPSIHSESSNASSMKNQISQKTRRCMWIFMMAFLAHPSPAKGTC
jgi:AbiV family abortive infection protein